MYTKPRVLGAEERTLFTDAYQSYLQELIRRARFMIDSRELSEDLVQDAFVKMWMYLIRGGKIDRARAFLHHTLGNIIVDTYRKHKMVSLDALLDQGLEPSADDSLRMIDMLDGKNALSLVRRLPRRYQKVLRMRYAHDLSYGEISHSTGQSKNTIAVQVHRGLEKLRLLYNHA